MKKLVIVLFVLILNQLVFAQKQNASNSIVIKGTLCEMVNNQKVALAFANVFIEGTDIVTTTDFDGSFVLESNESLNNLKCTFRGYETFAKEINTENTKAIELEIIMKPESTAMNTTIAKRKI